MIQKMLRTITAKYHLNAITLGEFTKMKVNGMEFQLWAFHAEGLGHVSAVQARGLFGMKQMDTLIINPTEKDMPLFSCDRVHAMGSDILTYELYDTILEDCDLSSVEAVKDAYSSLPDHDPGKHWHDHIKLPVSLSKKGTKAHTGSLNQCAMAYLEAFLETAESALYCDPAGKKEKASVYVEGLLTHGGPFTDVFMKSMGEEKTGFLFRNFLFGTIR